MVGDKSMVTEEEDILFIRGLGGWGRGVKAESHVTTSTITTTTQTTIPTLMSYITGYCGFCSGGSGSGGGSGVFGSKFPSKLPS